MLHIFRKTLLMFIFSFFLYANEVVDIKIDSKKLFNSISNTHKNNETTYIFNNFTTEDSSYISKKKIQPKVIIRTTDPKKVKKVVQKDIIQEKIVLLDQNISKPILKYKEKYKRKNITTILKKYRESIDSDKLNKNQKKLAIELRDRFLDTGFDNYDKIAIINAIEDIEDKSINKYEALLIVDTLIKEIKE